MKKLLMAATAALLMAGGAQAATLTSCADANPDVTNAVLNNQGCYVIDADSNIDGDITTDGGTELTFIEKDDGAFGGGTELILTGTSKVGTWQIANYDSDKTYVLVFKDGDKAEPSNQIAYIIGSPLGSYSSPFFNDVDGLKQKDISFVALFELVTPGADVQINPVPIPPGLLLLGTAVAGFGVMRRRRKSVAA